MLLLFSPASTTGPTDPLFVSASSNNTVASGVVTATNVVTAPANLVAGNLLVAVFTNSHNESTETMTAPAGWTAAGSTFISSIGNGAVFWKIATGSEPTSYTFTSTYAAAAGHFLNTAIHQYQGADSSTPLSAAPAWKAYTTATAAPAVSSVTPTTADGTAVLGWAAFNGGAVAAYPSGVTQRTAFVSAGNDSLYTADQYLSAAANTATGTPTATAGSDNWLVVQAVVNPAASAVLTSTALLTGSVTGAAAASTVATSTAATAAAITGAAAASTVASSTSLSSAAIAGSAAASHPFSLPYTEPFAGTDGDPWPGYWSSATSGSATIQAGRGRTTSAVGSYLARRQDLSAMPAAGDTDVTGTVTALASGVEQYAVIGINSDTGGANDWGGQNGYVLYLNYAATASSSSVQLQTVAATAGTSRATATKTLTGGVTYGFRLRRVGQVLNARVWDTAGAEPSSWDLSYTLTGTPLTGFVTLAGAGGAVTNAYAFDWDTVTVAPPPIALPYTETFPGASGAAWPAVWTTTSASGSGSATQTGSGTAHLVTGTSSGNSERAIATGLATGGDLDITGSFVFAVQQANWLNIVIDADDTTHTGDTSYTQNGYSLYIGITATPSTGQVWIDKIVGNGNPTPLTSRVTTTWTAGTTHFFRFQRIGTTLQYKLWTGGAGAEPGSWNASVTDGAAPPPAGWAGAIFQSSVAGAQTITLDALTVSVPTLVLSSTASPAAAIAGATTVRTVTSSSATGAEALSCAVAASSVLATSALLQGALSAAEPVQSVLSSTASSSAQVASSSSASAIASASATIAAAISGTEAARTVATATASTATDAATTAAGLTVLSATAPILTAAAGSAGSDATPLRAGETFDGADGAPWPAQWTHLGTWADQSTRPRFTLEGGRGRIDSGTGTPWGYSSGLAMIELSLTDVDARVDWYPGPTADGQERYGEVGLAVKTPVGTTADGDYPTDYIHFDFGYYEGVYTANWTKRVNGNDTFAPSVPIDIVPGGAYTIRVQRIGSTFNGKFWTKDSPEPAEWTQSWDVPEAQQYGGVNLVTMTGLNDVPIYDHFDDLRVLDLNPVPVVVLATTAVLAAETAGAAAASSLLASTAALASATSGSSSGSSTARASATLAATITGPPVAAASTVATGAALAGALSAAEPASAIAISTASIALALAPQEADRAIAATTALLTVAVAGSAAVQSVLTGSATLAAAAAGATAMRALASSAAALTAAIAGEAGTAAAGRSTSALGTDLAASASASTTVHSTATFSGGITAGITAASIASTSAAGSLAATGTASGRALAASSASLSGDLAVGLAATGRAVVAADSATEAALAATGRTVAAASAAASMSLSGTAEARSVLSSTATLRTDSSALADASISIVSMTALLGDNLVLGTAAVRAYVVLVTTGELVAALTFWVAAETRHPAQVDLELVAATLRSVGVAVQVADIAVVAGLVPDRLLEADLVEIAVRLADTAPASTAVLGHAATIPPRGEG